MSLDCYVAYVFPALSLTPTSPSAAASCSTSACLRCCLLCLALALAVATRTDGSVSNTSWGSIGSSNNKLNATRVGALMHALMRVARGEACVGWAAMEEGAQLPAAADGSDSLEEGYRRRGVEAA